MTVKEEYIKVSFERILSFIKNNGEPSLGAFAKAAILSELKTMFYVGTTFEETDDNEGTIS